ncbi:hypothetical protein M1307_02765 [Patescibacteria group bacterium]|nr:hypothetical protein [Patescibacteria group bacterium]
MATQIKERPSQTLSPVKTSEQLAYPVQEETPAKHPIFFIDGTFYSVVANAEDLIAWEHQAEHRQIEREMREREGRENNFLGIERIPSRVASATVFSEDKVNPEEDLRRIIPKKREDLTPKVNYLIERVNKSRLLLKDKMRLLVGCLFSHAIDESAICYTPKEIAKSLGYIDDRSSKEEVRKWENRMRETLNSFLENKKLEEILNRIKKDYSKLPPAERKRLTDKAVSREHLATA